MSSTHDIYDPPPAPMPWAPPRAEPLTWSRGDLAFLALPVAAVVGVAAWALSVDATMALLILLGGILVVLESWLTALGFLQRRRRISSLRARWSIFFAALIPWLVGLGLAGGLMLGLFLASDRGW